MHHGPIMIALALFAGGSVAGGCQRDEPAPSDDDSVAADDDAATDDDTAQAADTDGDGWTEGDGDCDDGDPAVHPQAIEVPLDGVDQDCDGDDVCHDLDCDGWPDLVFSSNFDGEAGDLLSPVYFGSSTGFGPTMLTELPTWNTTWNTIADLDGDGYLDVVFANHHVGEIHDTGSYIYWGGPDGLSVDHRSALEGIGAKGVTAADLDDDGHLDVVLSNGFDGATHVLDSYVYWGSAEGFSPTDRTELPTEGASGNTVADLDADGFVDIVFSCHHDDLTPNIDSRIFWGADDGYDPDRFTGLPTSMAIGVSAADLDADGWLDLVFSNNRDGETYLVDSVVYWGSADGFDADVYTGLPTLGAIGNHVADLDGDGHLDVVFANHHDDTTAVVPSVIYWGSPTGPDPAQATELPTLSARGVRAADLDLDGHLDLVFGNHMDDDGYEVDSYVYWGSAGGFSDHDRTDLPTAGAVGVSTTFHGSTR